MKFWAFDLDGTLVDSFGLYFSALTEIFARRGVEFADSHRHEALTDPLHVFLGRHLGTEAVPSSMNELQARSIEDALAIRPFERVPALIDALSARGSRIAVWTNRDLHSAKLILNSSGLARQVEFCVSGTCVSHRKPHPEGLSRISRRFDCDPGSVVMVGDHEHDVSAAKSGGARAIRASWHSYWPIERCAQADHQFFRVEELASWIEDQGPAAGR